MKIWNGFHQLLFIGNLYIFPLSHREIFSENNRLTMILKNIGQCNVKYITTLPIKTITSVVKVFNIYYPTAHPVRLAAIQGIMSVSSFTTADIRYVLPAHSTTNSSCRKIRAGIKDLFPYFGLCLCVMLDSLLCSFAFISCLTN